MQGKICGVFTLVAVAGLALSVAAQGQRSRSTSITMGNSSHTAQLPYTAEYKITNIRILADGSTITHESTEVIALDSQGRRMTSTTTVPISENQTPKTNVTVHDPEARTNSSWSVPGHGVTITMPTLGQPQRASQRPCSGGNWTYIAKMNGTAAAEPPRVKSTVQELGTDTILGVEARGHRTITTTPAGAVGNNEPLVRTNETWTAIARGLRGVVARSVSDDPQSGKMTRELTSFNQAEPDAAVFQPPADYDIVTREALSDPCASAEGAEKPTAPIAPPPSPEQ